MAIDVGKLKTEMEEGTLSLMMSQFEIDDPEAIRPMAKVLAETGAMIVQHILDNGSAGGDPIE